MLEEIEADFICRHKAKNCGTRGWLCCMCQRDASDVRALVAVWFSKSNMDECEGDVPHAAELITSVACLMNKIRQDERIGVVP